MSDPKDQVFDALGDTISHFIHKSEGALILEGKAFDADKEYQSVRIESKYLDEPTLRHIDGRSVSVIIFVHPKKEEE